MTIFLAILRPLLSWLLPLIAAFGFGAQRQRDKARAKALEDALNAERMRDVVEDSLGGADARDRLRKDWTR